MNAGKIATSRRLQETLAALRDGPKTSLQLHLITGSMAPHSDVAGVRANGIEIETTCVSKGVYLYSLVGEVANV